MRSIRFRLAPLLIFPALLLNAAHAAEDSPWIIDTELTLGSDDNVGRAERERDIASDITLLLNAGLAYNTSTGGKSALTLRAFAETERYQETTGLNRATLGGQFIFRWQHRLGYRAPFYQFNIGVQLDEYDSEQRNSTVTRSQLMATRRITDRITSSMGIEYQKRDSEATVFDLEQGRVFLNIDYALRTGWAYYGTFSYIDGQIWSTAQNVFCNGLPAADIFDIINASSAIESDDAFNDAYCGNWLAYRLEAQTLTAMLGINKAIDNSLALDLSLLNAQVDADGDTHYDRTLVRATVLKRF